MGQPEQQWPWRPQSPVTKTMAEGHGQTAAAAGDPCLVLDGGGLPRSPLTPESRRPALRDRLRSGREGPGQGWCSQRQRNAPAPRSRRMADPRTSALAHDEQASINATAQAASRQVVGSGRIEAAQPPGGPDDTPDHAYSVKFCEVQSDRGKRRPG